MLTLVGLGLGSALAAGAVRWLRSLAWNVDAADPSAWVAAAVVLLVVSLLAAATPALRATRVSPGEALKSD